MGNFCPSGIVNIFSNADKLDDRVLLCVGDQLEQHALLTQGSLVHLGFNKV